jgi:biotin synthase-like enzyme
VEAAPPQEPSCLDNLLDSGLDTFAANIEFFSPETRRGLLPGKIEINFDEYENVFAYCQKAKVKTFSALIAGPEHKKDTFRGVAYLARIGVPANLICLRPFPGSRIENHPRANPAWFLKVTKKALMIMEHYDVLDDLARTSGCGSCGGCSMEMNLYRLLKADSSKELHDFFLN